jgi:hypothetical protein
MVLIKLGKRLSITQTTGLYGVEIQTRMFSGDWIDVAMNNVFCRMSEFGKPEGSC